MRKIILLAILFLSSVYGANCQNQDLSLQIPKEIVYEEEGIVDSLYGITLFEPLNFRLGGDSIRNEKGYACNGWKKNHYKSGKLLHKGFYVDGQLKIYRNFYPNGDIERVFNVVDDYKSIMKIYYKGEILKTQVKFVGFDVRKWEDYHPNGFLSYYEENHRSGYYVTLKTYYISGQLESIFELSDKKKLKYTKKEFFEDGTVKTEGQSVFSKSTRDYIKTDTWKYFDKSGKLVKEEIYIMGKVDKETTY
ncbi:MAG: hypothetical protein JKY42_01895 [Flavobacteriales bacterium]|nr:hypothetical protein [Flavobacteriales bacterium]